MGDPRYDTDLLGDPLAVAAPGRRPLVSRDYDREDEDFYATRDLDATRAFLRRVKLRGRIWEPAAGEGHMAKVLSAGSYDVVSTDLIDRGFCGGGVDFLRARDLPPGVEAIVTNPPNKAGELFLRHALRLVFPVKGQVAFFQRLPWSRADCRADLFRGPAFALKIELTFRPVWFEPKPGDKGPMEDWAWYLFDWRHEGPPNWALEGRT